MLINLKNIKTKAEKEAALKMLGYQIIHTSFLNHCLIDNYLGKVFWFKSYRKCWEEFVKQNLPLI